MAEIKLVHITFYSLSVTLQEIVSYLHNTKELI